MDFPIRNKGAFTVHDNSTRRGEGSIVSQEGKLPHISFGCYRILSINPGRLVGSSTYIASSAGNHSKYWNF